MEPITQPQRLGDMTGTLKGAVRPIAPDEDRPVALTEVSGDEGSETVIKNDISPPEQSASVSSFDDFYRAHAGPIGQALELTLSDRELAEDALNEAMARALQRWNKVAHYANPQGWVYRVAMNWAVSWIRRRRRERDRPLVTAGSDVQPRDHDLQQAMVGLSVEHRSVVVCRFFLDWSVKQTAQSLDIAEGTVKSRLARALENIREELEGSP